MLTRRLKEFFIEEFFPPFGYRSSSSSGLKSIWGVKSTFDFYKILPKVKRRLDPQSFIALQKYTCDIGPH